MKLKDIVTYIAFIVMLVIALTMSFCFPNFFNHFEDNNEIKTNETISNYLKDNKNIIVEQKLFGDNILEVLTKDNNYNVVWFNNETGDYLTIDAFINDSNGFNEKIKELLFLKYPRFIAEALLNNTHNVYYFKDNELVIYYYDYEIDPMPSEKLYLRVNYNEIVNYLKIKVSLDDTYSNETGFIIDNTKKYIALTFDDGPGKYTSRLVGYLNDGFAHATFFMQGSRLNSYKDAVKDVANSGSEIAYHSYKHKYFKDQTISEIKSDLDKSNKDLKNIIGESFKMVRPPYGSINDEIKKVLDMPIILWNVDTEDWKNKDSSYLVNYVLENVAPGDIILFHDIHETSVEAIPEILRQLYVKGYQVVTVSELATIYNKELKSGVTYRSFK